MSDYRFFRFRPIHKFCLDELEKPYLHFSLPDQLNDPFDCNISLEIVIKNLIEKADGKNKDNLKAFLGELRKFQVNVAKLGICSFSLDYENSVMWSYYANQHKGVCLVYEFPMSFLDDQERILGVDTVKYVPNPITEWLEKSSGLYTENHYKFITDLLKLVLTSKGPSWEYEKEVRIIRPEPGEFHIPKEFIKEICFGLCTSSEDIKKVTTALGSRLSNITLHKMERSSDDFGLTPVTISE